MEIELASLSGKDIYGFMIQAIVPRPIAWVLSDNGTGTLNLAPFSYFNGVSSRPPLISLSIGKKRDGTKKDTWRNIEERGDFVVHVASVALADKVSDTSAPLDFGDSEITRTQVKLSKVAGWTLPRVSEAKIAFSCVRHQIIEVGETPQALILGRVEKAYVADDIVQDQGNGSVKISARALDPLARLGGDEFGQLGRVFEVPRPD